MSIPLASTSNTKMSILSKLWKKFLSLIGSVFSLNSFENFFLTLAIISFCLILCAFGVIIYWSNQHLVYQNRQLFDFNNQQLEVSHPILVRIGDPPTLLTFIRRSTTPFTNTLSITVSIPQTLTLMLPNEQEKALTTEIVFPATSSTIQTATIGVVNSRIYDGLLSTISTFNVNALQRPRSFNIKVEGTWQATIRNLFSRETNENNPLLLLVPVVLSALGLVYTGIQKRQELQSKQLENIKEDRKKKEENDQQQLQIQQTQQLEAALFESFRNSNFTKAADIYSDLKNNKVLATHIDSIKLKTAERLLSISKWEMSNDTDLPSLTVLIEQMADEWPDETASALTYATLKSPVKKEELREAFRTFPVDKLSEDQRKEFEQYRRLETFLAPQTAIWPINLSIQGNMIYLDNIAHRKDFINPFPYDQTESEIDLLFSEEIGAFWPDHHLYQLLVNSNSPQIVSGVPGAGKTALGLALGRFRTERDVLACYLHGQPNKQNVQVALAKQIMQFIQKYPTWLVELNSSLRDLVAYFCVNALGKPISLGFIADAWRELPTWLESESISEKRKSWEAIAYTHLRLLENSIENVRNDVAFRDRQWVMAMSLFGPVLGFRQTRLVIDATGNCVEKWLDEIMISEISLWQTFGLQIIILIRDDVAHKLEENRIFESNRNITLSRLTWTQGDLENLTQWRYRQIAGFADSRHKLEELIDSDILSILVKKSDLNPRHLIALWNQTFVSAGGTPINMRHISNAARRINKSS